MYLSKNLYVSFRLPILLAYSCLWYNPFCFCSVSCDFSRLISNFIDLCCLPAFSSWWAIFFFLINLLNVYHFVYVLNQLVVSLIFAIVFLISISFISALIFMISFLLLTLGFVCCSFSSCFRCKTRVFIWDVSHFLR